jgi:hypothetical protein
MLRRYSKSSPSPLGSDTTILSTEVPWCKYGSLFVTFKVHSVHIRINRDFKVSFECTVYEWIRMKYSYVQYNQAQC